MHATYLSSMNVVICNVIIIVINFDSLMVIIMRRHDKLRSSY